MITAAICDDEKRVLDDLCKKISSAFSDLKKPIRLFTTDDPFTLLEYIKKNVPDVLFLDIDMPKLGGMDIAQFIIENNIKTLLVFVTSHDALVYQSFQYRPFAFVRKSFFDEEIGSVAERVAAELQKQVDSFSFRTGDSIIRIKLSDIIYFESNGNYIDLHLSSDIYKFRGTISSVECELSDKGFIRIHKGFLVNQQHIFALRGDDLELDSHELLPIGRKNKENAKRSVMRYMR